jgi:hypothetical protein
MTDRDHVGDNGELHYPFSSDKNYPNMADINVSPGAVNKWMIMETIKMRTFAYVRAGKDRFEITCRGALGREGYEQQAHGTWTRPTDNYQGKQSSVSYINDGVPKPETLSVMWDQKDNSANGVLPPSAHVAEHIADWGYYGDKFFAQETAHHPDDVGGTRTRRAAPGRRRETDGVYTVTNQKHEFLPGVHGGGYAAFSHYKKPPWDWGGAQAWPVELWRNPFQLRAALGTTFPYKEGDIEYPTVDARNGIVNQWQPWAGAAKAGHAPYSSPMSRRKLSWGRDDMFDMRDRRLHQNNSDISPAVYKKITDFAYDSYSGYKTYTTSIHTLGSSKPERVTNMASQISYWTQQERNELINYDFESPYTLRGLLSYMPGGNFNMDDHGRTDGITNPDTYHWIDEKPIAKKAIRGYSRQRSENSEWWSGELFGRDSDHYGDYLGSEEWLGGWEGFSSADQMAFSWPTFYESEMRI